MSASTNFLKVLNQSSGAGVEFLGVPGEKGDQGVQGEQGATGPNSGFTGATGAQGAQGVAGPQGVTGFTGFTGYTGFTGRPGPQGEIGSNGTNGTNGVDGIDGSNGSIDSPVENSIVFNENVTVKGISFTDRISESTLSSSVVVSGNELFLDYSLGSIFYVSGAISSNLTVYVENVPTDVDKTYTLTFLMPFSGGSTRFFANAMQMKDVGESAYSSQPMLANGGLENVAPNASALFVSQSVSILKSATSNARSAFTSVNSMF